MLPHLNDFSLFCLDQVLYILATLTIRFWQMGQLTNLWPQQVQVIKWPQSRKTQSITLSMHTLHLCSISRMVPSSIFLLAETLSLNPMPHNIRTFFTCWVVNFSISCSVT